FNFNFKQTFVTTGIDLLETCQAAFLNHAKPQLKVPRPLHCIRFLVNTFLRANSLNHPSGSLYNHKSLTSSSSLGSHSTLTCIILRLHTNRKQHCQKGGANIQSVPSKQTCTDVPLHHTVPPPSCQTVQIFEMPQAVRHYSASLPVQQFYKFRHN